MADEKINTPEEDEEEVSWEDAFREAAEAQSDQAVHEPQVSAEDVVGGGAGAEAEMPADDAGDVATSAGAAATGVDIDFLLDISLDVTVEIGRKKILVNDLLQMQQGSVIDLDKMVGEPFEVYVNGKIMAYGEIVVVNEKFGIRLTDVIDPRERIEKLG